MILPYIKYLLRAGNEHSIHSPFVFRLYREVIRDNTAYQDDFSALETLRRTLKKSGREIEILDLGAGSRVNRSNRRSLGEITRNAEKPEKFGRLFYRLCRYLQPKNVVELGTSLGLTTLYFSKALAGGRLYTFEGCPETSAIAAENFRALNAPGIEIITGNIDHTLAETLKKLEVPLDIVYFDANHRYEPTLRYFRECLSYSHPGSLFIMDDIYWSKEMTAAWEEIKRHPEVTVTIDLFWIGLVFFRKEQAKQDFILRF